MSAFVETLLRLKDRAEQEANSITSDAIPNPVAGLGIGGEELHYNPLLGRLPLIGGATNALANIPLHAAGMIQEGFGETAKMLAGYGMQAGAKIDQISGEQLTPERQAVDAAILAQGLAHPGRSLDEARNGPDSGVAYLGGAAEILANPGNYINAIGAGGRALSEAPGVLGGIGKAIMGGAAAGEASNRMMSLPLALSPRARKSLLEIPEFLRATDAPKEIAPLIAAVKGSLPDNAQQVANIGDNLDTAVRAPLNANIDVPSPTGDVVQRWLERDRASAVRPQGAPGELDSIDWLRQSLLKNLEAEHGQKYGRLPSTVKPGQAALTNRATGGATMFPAGAVGDVNNQTSPFIQSLTASTAATPAPDLVKRAMGMATLKGGTPTLSEIQRELKVGMVEAMRLQDAASGRATVDIERRAGTLFPESIPQEAELPGFIKKLEQTSSTGNAREAKVPVINDRRRIPKGAVIDDPLADFDGMRQAVLKLQDKLGRPPTYDEIRYRTGSGPLQSRDLADWVAEQAAGGETPHPDLDRMDALRGREAVDNIANLFAANYKGSPEQIMRNLVGKASLNSEGRVILKDGTDETRGLLNYLLHRGDMSEEERIAYQSTLGAKRPQATGLAGDLVGGTAGGATAVASPPATLRELALDPQFGGSELPGPSYFARKLGISNQEVNAGLEALQQEGVLKPLNKWYGLAPDAPVADDARAAWQRDYVGQSRVGTDILSGDVAGSGIGQADMNAMSPADRMAALRKLTETPPANPVDDLFGTAADQVSTAPRSAPEIDRAGNLNQFVAGNDLRLAKPDGTPKVVYHGTGNAFDTFERQSTLKFGKGYYFTEDPAIAGVYAEGGGEGANIIPTYLSIKNPIDLGELFDGHGYPDIIAERPLSTASINEAGRAAGYDGIYVPPEISEGQGAVWVAFDPGQIKSATGNRGTFDPRDPSMLGIQFQPTRLGVAASGAGIGGLAGLMAADTTDDNHQDDWGGAVGGALAGAALGAGLASPGGARNLEFAGELGRSALKKQGDAFATGSKDINWKSISGQWSGQTVENVRNLIQEAMSSVPMLLDKGGSLKTVRENADSIKDAYIMGARDKSSLLPDRAKTVLDSLGLKDAQGNFLVPDMGTEGFQEATGRMQGDLNPIASGIIEGLLPSFTPLGSVPVLGNAVGFAKGFTAPIRKEVYSVIDGITKSSFRSAIWEVATKDAAEQAAQLFASSVLQKTNRVLALPTDGMFSPKDVRQALVNVPAGTAESLVREWESYTRAINATGEDAAKQAFGDFSKFDPTTATRGEKVFNGFETGLRKIVPFSSWYIRALPIAAEIASHHPAFTLATLGVLADQARQLKEEGKPGYMVGTIPFDSKTPVVGKLADVLTGGRGGTGRVNVINGILPFAGQTLGADELGDDATLYQKVESWAGRAGFSFNPIVQGVMYAVGQDWQRPGAMSRTANLEQALPGPEGPSLLQGPLDFVRKQGGNSVSTTTPVERRIAQIVYEQTGLPINAKENAALAAATLDPHNPITQQAEREVARGNVAKNAASLTLPVAVTASTDLDQQIGKARAESKAAGTDVPVKKTADELAQQAVLEKAYPLQMLLAQQAQGTAGAPDPLTQIYRGADTKGRAYQALAAWEEENAAIKYFAPTYYGQYKQELMRELGLSPY